MSLHCGCLLEDLPVWTLHLWMLENYGEPRSLQKAMASWFVIIVLNMWRDSLWGLLLVSRKCESWCEKEQLLPESSCEYHKSLLVLHYTWLSMSLVPFHKPLGSVVFLPLQVHTFLPSLLCRGSPRLCRQTRCYHHARLLLNCSSVGNVIFCLWMSRDWSLCMELRAVVAWIYWVSSLYTWSVFR